MGSYRGLDDRLRREVYERDGKRCRWCGRTEERAGGVDIHHIRYRRSSQDDVAWNLICLCRGCHSHVHGLDKNSPPKRVCQEVLWSLVEKPGRTGMQVLRWMKREQMDAICDAEGEAREPR